MHFHRKTQNKTKTIGIDAFCQILRVQHKSERVNSCGVVANELDCDIVVSMNSSRAIITLTFGL